MVPGRHRREMGREQLGSLKNWWAQVRLGSMKSLQGQMARRKKPGQSSREQRCSMGREQRKTSWPKERGLGVPEEQRKREKARAGGTTRE